MALNSIDPYRGSWRLAGTMLLPLSGLYGAVTRARATAFRRGWKRSEAAGVPVISVGNITAGGTGKTPMVKLLAQWLRSAGRHPAILTRGYGGAGQDGVLVLEAGATADPAVAGDEPCLLARGLPGVPVLVSPDRTASARQAVDTLGADILLLDDGYQHLQLHRDFDILLVDASEPLWKNRVIPSGTLREPFSAMGRADAVVFTRTPAQGVPGPLEKLVNRHCPGRPQFSARHEPVGLTAIGPCPLPPRDDAPGFLLVSGIGQPAAFRRTAEDFGLKVVGEKRYADHHVFSDVDLAEIVRLLESRGGSALLFTEKDAVRLGPLADGLERPAGYLEIRMAVTEEDRLKALVLRT